MWEAWAKNDRLKRWRIVDTSSPGRGKTVIAENIRHKETAEQICRLHNGAIHISVIVSEPQPIETAPHGPMMLAFEPIYGWLIVMRKGDGWEQKSSGNFWMDVPSSVVFTHWQPYPRPPVTDPPAP